MAALYIRSRNETTRQEIRMTARGAPATRSCVATICAAPLNMIIDIASAAAGEAPAAIAQCERHAEEYGMRRYSLYTGDPGTAIYLLRCIEATDAWPGLG